MTVPPPPPLADVLDALQHVMLPAAGASAFVFAAGLLIGRRFANLGAALAVVAGLLAGNWEKVPMPALPTASAWTHLPLYALVLLGVGLLTQVLADAVPRLRVGTWPIRVVVLAFAADAVIPADPGLDRLQFYALLVAGSLTLWATLDRLAECGFPAEVAGLLGVTALLGGGVMLYAHSAKFMDMMTILGSALLGVAVVAGPVASFVLVAVAPLALLPWLVPNLSRRKGPWPRVLRAASVLALLAAALVLAGRVETLPWEQDW